MPPTTSQRREDWSLTILFCAALLAQFIFTTTNWKSAFMPGHEFRQSQTAIVSYYIDKDNNFSLLYETPVIGKPWVSILLEVPVYEWSVVLLSRALHIPHFMAARTVSLTCLYLALPSLFLLLGRFGVSRPRRLLTLSLILTCPVYIFYSRAFLMESMEIMCCGWFLFGFVRTMDERRWSWLALTIVAGTGAALIKSITFAVWLLPAAGYGAWMLWRDLRAGKGWKPPVQTILWGFATVAVALGLLRWWIAYTDPIKAAHASGWIFTSKNLSEGNWGLTNLAARFSGKTWSTLLQRWSEAIAPPWIVLVGLAAGLAFFPRQRWRVLGVGAVFFLAQLMFPFAYAFQDYYYYACTIFLLAAIGFAFHGLLDSRLPHWCTAILLAGFLGAQISTYWHGYRVAQVLLTNGGFPFTTALRDLAPKDSVLIIAGADWAAMIPLYSEHRALMIRNGLEYDPAYLNRAFDDLADEDVSALVMVGDQRKNQVLINRIVTKFNLEPTPTFTHPVADVYFSRLYAEDVRARLRASNHYDNLTFNATGPTDHPKTPFKIPPAYGRSAFANITPAPYQAYFTFGVGHGDSNGDDVLSAHPDCDVWLHAPADATQIIWNYGIHPDAYERSGDVTDGVEFIVVGEVPGGSRRQIYHRVLDPAANPADRGRQHVIIPYHPRPNETLIFSDRPNLNYAFDWAYWQKIEVK